MLKSALVNVVTGLTSKRAQNVWTSVEECKIQDCRLLLSNNCKLPRACFQGWKKTFQKNWGVYLYFEIVFLLPVKRAQIQLQLQLIIQSAIVLLARMGYELVTSEDERYNCFSQNQLVDQISSCKNVFCKNWSVSSAKRFFSRHLHVIVAQPLTTH